MIETIIAAMAANTVNFAKVNSDSIVENVISLNKADIENWQSFIRDILMLDGTWVQDLNRESFNKNAAIGKEYVAEFNQFRFIKPEGNPDFIYNAEIGAWIPPVEIPADAETLLGFSDPWGIDILDDSKKYMFSPRTNSWELFTSQQEDPIKDFINSKALPSFIENEEGFLVPPIPQPKNGKPHKWDEETLSWIEIDPSEIPAFPALPVE